MLERSGADLYRPFAFGFQTKLTLQISGLGYWGYRWYDPASGVWLSKDPLREAGGLNLYAYCGNDPINSSDPLGLNANTISLYMPGIGAKDFEVGYYGPGGIHEVCGVGIGAMVAVSALTVAAVYDIAAASYYGVAYLVRGGVAAWTARAAKNADKFSRTPKSLMDEMVLDAAKQGKGAKMIDNLGDPKFKGMEKWSYGEKSAAGLRSEVHYVRDPNTGKLMDFKFKHQVETYR